MQMKPYRRWLLQKYHACRRLLHDCWYRIRDTCYSRFSTVKPRYLGHGWCDRDVLMAHAMFEILSDFVEKEIDFETFNEEPLRYTNINGQRVVVEHEIRQLYVWWHTEYHGRYIRMRKDFARDALEYDSAHVTLAATHVNDVWLCWNDRWKDPACKTRSRELHNRTIQLQMLSEQLLNKQLLRLLAIRPFMWT